MSLDALCMTPKAKHIQSKFRNRKVQTEEGKFDSRRELKRWNELKLLQRVGEISELERQVRFRLLPGGTRDDGKPERPVDYVADFVYVAKGKKIVEDAKGFKTTDYILKRKMMLFLLGLTIQEV